MPELGSYTGLTPAPRLPKQPPMINDPRKPGGAQSIRRAASLLREIAANNRQGMRLVDLAARSGLERPTVHRILKSLIADSLVMQNPDTRRYFLGHALFEFGLAASRQFNLRDLCQASLHRLAEKTGDTVFLTVRSGTESVCIDRKEGAFPIKAFTLNVGDRRPLGVGAGGLAILSFLPSEEIEAIVSAEAPMLHTYNLNESQIMVRVRRTQQSGFAMHDSRTTVGVKVVGMAIKNRAGEPIAAISISGISSRITGKRRDEILALLEAEVRHIEKMDPLTAHFPGA